MKPDFEKMATTAIGLCTCLDAYKNRELVDPQCARCNKVRDIVEVLGEAYAAGYRDGQERMKRRAAGAVPGFSATECVEVLSIEEPPT